MTLESLQKKSEDLEEQGYTLIYTSEDKFVRYLASEDNEKMLVISADPASSKAFARICLEDQENTMLPEIYDEIDDGDLHITVMERLYSLDEMDGGTEGHYGRMGRNFTNVLSGHDPARGTDDNHQKAFEMLITDDQLQRIGSSIAERIRDSLTGPASEALMFDRSRQHMMFKKREQGSFHFIYMEPLRSIGSHSLGFSARFNQSADSNEESALNADKTEHDGAKASGEDKTEKEKITSIKSRHHTPAA